MRPPRSEFTSPTQDKQNCLTCIEFFILFEKLPEEFAYKSVEGLNDLIFLINAQNFVNKTNKGTLEKLWETGHKLNKMLNLSRFHRLIVSL